MVRHDVALFAPRLGTASLLGVALRSGFPHRAPCGWPWDALPVQEALDCGGCSGPAFCRRRRVLCADPLDSSLPWRPALGSAHWAASRPGCSTSGGTPRPLSGPPLPLRTHDWARLPEPGFGQARPVMCGRRNRPPGRGGPWVRFCRRAVVAPVSAGRGCRAAPRSPWRRRRRRRGRRASARRRSRRGGPGRRRRRRCRSAR